MKLPSLNYVVHNARHSLVRFHFSILASVIAVTLGIYLAECYDDISNILPYLNVMLCAALGISLFFCVDVFTESRRYNSKIKLVYDLLALGLLAIMYFTLPDSDSTQNTSLPYIRYGTYSITIHLLVAIIPFISKGQLNGFWHYNKILFVRFLTSFLYSAFLYGGLSLALGSLNFLFDVDLHNELFFDLFILIAGFFNTWFFVSGIPQEFNSLDDIYEYPKGIKIFSQYVLLPLLILYVLILYVYASKIVFLWSWPKGIVSYLIACVAVLGILTHLLIHPYGTLPENTWIKRFSKAYYFILLPLVALLFTAIGMRMADYGITINRYVILLLGCWLTLVCFYFIAGKTNIKFIPISLAVILVLVSFGYWGMFAVSARSQVNRLRAILEQNEMIQHGKVMGEVLWQKDSLPKLITSNLENVNDALLIDSLHNEVKSILDYLDNHHGFASIRAWYHQDVDSIVNVHNRNNERWNKLNEAEAYMRTLGLAYEYRYEDDQYNYSHYSSDWHDDVTNVSSYDYLVTFQIPPSSNMEDQDTEFSIDDKSYTIRHSLRASNKLFLITPYDSITYNTDALIKTLTARHKNSEGESIPLAEMTLLGSDKNMDTKIEFSAITLDSPKDSSHVTYMDGRIFIRLKTLEMK